jgi:hypothetical protein
MSLPYVSIFKAPQPGKSQGQLDDGYYANDFPDTHADGGRAYFAKQRPLAELYAEIYREGVIEIQIPWDVYVARLARYESLYIKAGRGLSWPFPMRILTCSIVPGECIMVVSLEWERAKHSLRVGDRIKGIVRSHEPYGVFVEIAGVPFRGLVQITDFKDNGRMTVEEYPRLGDEIEACVLGFKDVGQQIWLGMKPSQTKVPATARQ